MPLVAVLILAGIGFLFGLAFGRWWALVAGAIFGVYIASASKVDEVSPEFLGTLLGGIVTAGIAAGVAARKWGARAAREESPGE